MKKIVYTSALCASLLSYIQADNHCISPYGIHAGIQGGYANIISKLDRNPPASLVALDRDSNKISDENVSFGAFVGGYYNFNNVFLGLDLFGNYADFKAKFKDSSQANIRELHELKMKHSFGAALSVGYRFNSAIPYLKAGVIQTKWDYKVESKNLATGNMTNKKDSPNKTGFLIGAGTDIYLKKNFKMGLEWNHMRYDGFSVKSVALGKMSVKPRANTIMVRAAYVFSM